MGAFWPRASTECTVPQRAKEVVHRDSCHQPRDHGLSRRAHYQPGEGDTVTCHRAMVRNGEFVSYGTRGRSLSGPCVLPNMMACARRLIAHRPLFRLAQHSSLRAAGRWDASTCCDGSGVHRRQIVLRDHAVLKPFQQRTPPGPRGSPEILAQCDDDMRVVEPHATYIAALLGLVNGCTRYGRQLTTETRRRTWAPSWPLHG